MSNSKSAVCTLFEGNYHYGVGALINSLVAHDFSGEIFVGYRGELPDWVIDSGNTPDWSWPHMTVMRVNDHVVAYFLPLSTDYHFTNYKPHFMLELLDGPAHDADEIFYLDPDIVVRYSWPVLRQWVNSGVALCADVNSPMLKNHPKRYAWREYFSAFGFTLNFKTEIYVNGGFVGVKRENREFLEIWKQLMEKMGLRIGGLSKSQLIGAQICDNEKTIFSPFSTTDQDCLNATIEVYTGETSMLSRDAMGFERSFAILPHALGQPKPWDKNFLLSAFNGFRVRQIDKDFWNFVEAPIRILPKSTVRRKKSAINWANLIGRFYHR